jgi:hypothetical protein
MVTSHRPAQRATLPLVRTSSSTIGRAGLVTIALHPTNLTIHIQTVICAGVIYALHLLVNFQVGINLVHGYRKRVILGEQTILNVRLMFLQLSL